MISTKEYSAREGNLNETPKRLPILKPTYFMYQNDLLERFTGTFLDLVNLLLYLIY